MLASQISKRITAITLASIAAVCATVQAASTLNGEYYSVTLSGSVVVALDTDREIHTSTDGGASFAASTGLETDFQSESVEGFGTTVIAVGDSGFIARSTVSGASWATATTPSINGLLYASAARLDGANPIVWLAVGFDGFDAPVFRSVDDGATWTQSATVSAVDFRDVLWTGSRWVAVGMDDFGFEGLVYTSTDGLTWNASTLPVDTAPLKSVATDGAGIILATGEAGELIRSTDDGLNFTSLSSGVSEDLFAVQYDGLGTFFLGGAAKVLIEVDDTATTVKAPPTVDASPILDLLVIDNEPVVSGAFSVGSTRTTPLQVILSQEGDLDFRLTVPEALSGLTYFVETTNDLTVDNWTTVPGLSASGVGATLFFDVSQDGLSRFWRVVEF